MAKGINQKLKLLYIIKILSEKTDENHPMSANRLIEELAKYEVGAERKSIYDDIEQLQNFGYDIELNKSRTNGGYYLSSREFEITELKLLVDSVQASRFITLKKSRELIHKLEKMASEHDMASLKRTVYVQNRIKTDNESIYYVVNDIYQAIQTNKKISYLYMDWNLKKQKVARHNGEKSNVSPLALTFKDENYYLIAYDSKDKKVKHYRVDKIKEVELLDEVREGLDALGDLDVALYTNKSFGMFGGEETMVTIRFKNSSVGIVIDRFGTDIDIRPIDENFSSARVSVNVSNQFFGWITSIGGDIVIEAPEDTKKAYIAFLQDITNLYK